MIPVWLMKAGVFDRTTMTARRAELSWSASFRRLLEKCAADNDPRTKLTGWAAVFGDVIDGADKVDALNVRLASAVVLDLDDVGHQDNDPDGLPRSVDDVVALAQAALPDTGFAYWETWRSRPGAVRMRLLFPLHGVVPALELHKYWAMVAMKLVQAGLPSPDRTSREPSRAHLLPTVHGSWGIVDAPALEPHSVGPTVAQAVVAPAPRTQRRQAANVGNRSHLAPDTLIEWERGGTAFLGTILPEMVEAKARSGEPNKARCRCPVHADGASYSAFVRFHRGVLFVVCTSTSHGHAAGTTWVGGVVTADPTALPLPHPYSQSTTGALLRETGKDSSGTATFAALAYTVPRVTCIYVDDESGDEWWKLEWEGRLGPSTVTLRRDEAASASKLIDKAGRAGLDINEGNKRELTRFLSDFVSHNATRIRQQSVSSRMGWFGRGFLWGRTWLADPFGIEQPRELVVSAGDGRAQLANGLRAEGTFDGWCTGVAALGPYPLVMAGILVSIASCLVELVNTQSCVFEWASPSGTGKTTSLAIAASVWGHPEELQSSWDGTKVAMEHNAAFLSAIPMLLDDTKTVAGSKNSIDPEWAIYRVTSGEGRQRAAPGGQSRQTAKWALNMLTTGEEPVYGSGQAGGARARLLSIQDPPYGLATKDSVSRLVGPLCAAILPNHGHAGPAVVALASAIGPEKLRQSWAKKREYWIDALAGKHSAHDRVSNHLAMLDVAGTLLKEAAKRAGNQQLANMCMRSVVRAVSLQCLDADKAAGEVDPVQRAKTDFYSWCVAHRASFWATSINGTDLSRGPSRGWFGRWDGGESWTDIYVTADAIQKFIDEHRYSMGARMLAAQWIKDGFITPSAERPTSRVRIAGSPDWCYRIERKNCATAAADLPPDPAPLTIELELP